MMRWIFVLLLSMASALAQTPPQARPSPPPAESLAELGRPGWTGDSRNGCWVWNPNPQAEETVLWNGPCEDGPAQGDGLLEWRYMEAGEPRGERYVGSLARGRMHGIGTFLDSQGSIYQGEWQVDRMHGCGVYKFVGGAKFRGEWKYGKMDGYGVYENLENDTFMGKFEGQFLEVRTSLAVLVQRYKY